MIFFLAICKLQQNEKWSQMKIVFFNVFSLFAIVLLLKLFLHGSGYYCCWHALSGRANILDYLP